MSNKILVWDSELTGPYYVDKSIVEYAELLWAEGKMNVFQIVNELRQSGGLCLADAHFVGKYLQANFPKNLSEQQTQTDFPRPRKKITGPFEF